MKKGVNPPASKEKRNTIFTGHSGECYSLFMKKTWQLSPDRCFDPEPSQRKLTRQLYSKVKSLPIISPHGHVSPGLLAAEKATFGTPAQMFIIPDHYVFRMLFSQGIPMERLGVPSQDGSAVETDHRRIWQLFAENFHLFAGTPSGLWISDELINVFGIKEKPSPKNARILYDELQEKLASPAYSPRALFKKFKIEVMSTTDPATDTLEEHRKIQKALGKGRVLPCFRPDAVVNLDMKGWLNNIQHLSEVTGTAVDSYKKFIKAIEDRRAFFQQNGAVATDHAALAPYTERLSDPEAENIFQHALKGRLEKDDAARFTAHMLMEFARMSCEDGLVMQLHVGSFRNHNRSVYNRFGLDKGADIPVQVEWTHNLHKLLNTYGSDTRLKLILFTLDETNYSRELATLAGHYPALVLGPPWWFHDSVNGMQRYLDQVVETAGIYNTAGFNDDTRAFASIPARHDVWRRVTCNWLAGQVVHGLIDREQAPELAEAFAYTLAKKAYRLD